MFWNRKRTKRKLKVSIDKIMGNTEDEILSLMLELFNDQEAHSADGKSGQENFYLPVVVGDDGINNVFFRVRAPDRKIVEIIAEEAAKLILTGDLLCGSKKREAPAEKDERDKTVQDDIFADVVATGEA